MNGCVKYIVKPTVDSSCKIAAGAIARRLSIMQNAKCNAWFCYLYIVLLFVAPRYYLETSSGAGPYEVYAQIDD